MTTHPKAISCPGCGSENITSNEWSVDEDNAAKFGADEFSEIWAFECMDCLFAAPVESWQRRVSDWVSMESPPNDGQACLISSVGSDCVLMAMWRAGLWFTYDNNPEPVSDVTHWMPIPPVPEVSE
jgi:hypothetical protein